MQCNTLITIWLHSLPPDWFDTMNGLETGPSPHFQQLGQVVDPQPLKTPRVPPGTPHGSALARTRAFGDRV